ncbi:MAG: SET domain-containing protein [Bacteroidia bacterium]
MKEKYTLVVKKSQLPKAGKGLFTLENISKGELVVEYKGEIITDKEANRRAANDDAYGYMFYINKKHCIDAYYTPQHKARYANDADGLGRTKNLKNNSVYEIVGKKCFIKATKSIKAGEEIFVSYGKEYWKVIKENIEIEKQNKKLEKQRKK